MADVIGEALTDLMISREENEIYTPKNRELVVESARLVADRLIERMAERIEGTLPHASPLTSFIVLSKKARPK